jgi:hypothetical protein
MVVLDATVVNIALPSTRTTLGFSDAKRQWIVTAILADVRQPAAPVRPASATCSAASATCSAASAR